MSFDEYPPTSFMIGSLRPNCFAAFKNAEAKDQHNTQYFEMFGNRAIYHDGWMARVIHMIPWQGKPLNTFQDDKWELYNLKEAIANNVYPLAVLTHELF